VRLPEPRLLAGVVPVRPLAAPG